MLALDRMGPELQGDVWNGGLAFGADGTLFAGQGGALEPVRTLLAWDPSTQATRWVAPVTDAPMDVGVSPEGWIVTAYQKRAWLWDAAGGAPLGVLDDDDAAYAPIACLAGDRLLASTRPDEGPAALVLWDVRGRRRVGPVVAPLPSFARSVAIDPNGARVAVFCGGPLSLWDLASGAKLHDFGGAIGTHPYPSATMPLVFHPDGARVIAGGALGEEGPVIFDAATGAKTTSLRGPKPPSDACALAVSPDGRWLVGAYGWQEADHHGWQDVGLRIWDLASSQGRPQRIEMQGAPLGHLAFSPDGARLAASSLAALHVWTVRVDPSPGAHGRVNPSVG
jgi:WD40 repeat protein